MRASSFVAILACLPLSVPAAPPIVENGKVVPRETQVRLELFAGRFGSSGVHAQTWSRDLSKLGYSIRIKQGGNDTKPELRESMLGRTRIVSVVGQMDTSGTLIFPQKTFKLGQTAKLAEWLRELKTYGAEGSPEGKPAWGLNQTQFEALLTALAAKIENDLAGKSLDECLGALPLSKDHPVRFSADAKEFLKKHPATAAFPEWQRVQGMSLGSGLAMVLNEYGLGFRPSRTPSGAIELVVDPVEKDKKQWPIGWPSKTSPDLLAPKFVERIDVSLSDQRLLDVAQIVSVQTKIPMVFHMQSIRDAGLKLKDLKVSHPPAKRNWSRVLTRVLYQHQLVQRLLVDEAGRPFILVRTRKSMANESFK